MVVTLFQQLISSSSLIPVFLFTSTIIILVSLFLILKNHLPCNKRAAPNQPLPEPWKLPVIGNLHQLIGDDPRRRLKHLAQKYGPDLMQIREEEVKGFVDRIASCKAREVVDLSEIVEKWTSSVTSRAAFGKVQELGNEFVMVVAKISEVVSGFQVSDLYPSLKFLPVLDIGQDH